MIRHQIARILKAIADRIEPPRPIAEIHRDMLKVSQHDRDVLGKAITDIVSQELGGRTGLGFRYPDDSGLRY